MAKRQQQAVEKRALQQRRRIEAERLAKQQADLEEQRRKLLEDPELSDEDQDLDQDLEDPALVLARCNLTLRYRVCQVRSLLEIHPHHSAKLNPNRTEVITSTLLLRLV